MTDSDTLHTAIRRYCLERCDVLRAQRDRFRAWGSAGDALHLKSRLAIVDALLTAVEGVVPSAFPFPHVLAEKLVAVGQTARGAATISASRRGSQGSESAVVMRDERDRYTRAVRALAEAEPRFVDVLPHRRTVLAEERAALTVRLRERWHAGGAWWIPWGDTTIDEEVVVVDAAALRDRLGDDALRDILHRGGVQYAFELWAHGGEHGSGEPDREWAVADVTVRSGWAERYWFSLSLDWLIYTTHEGAAAIAGEWLLAEIKSHWPTWASHLYVEPRHPQVTLAPDEATSETTLPDARAGSLLRWRFLGAAGAGKVEELAALLAQGADINGRSPKAETALHWAAERGQEGSVRFLLEQGADVNARGAGGMSPLMSAVSNGHAGVIRLLLASGASIDVRAEDTPDMGPRAGRTALEIASASEYLAALGSECRAEVIALLLEAAGG